MVDNEQNKKIEMYLKMDLDDLLRALPQYKRGHIAYAKKTKDEDLEEGKEIIVGMRGKLHSAICVEWDYCSRRNDEKLSNLVNLTAAVIDVIAGQITVFPPIAIAAIVVKMKLNNFCECSD